MTAPPPRTAVGFRSARGRILGVLMLCISLVALDATVIATAVPSVVRDLGGFNQFPWLFSSYLLTQAVTVPVYGKLADLLGRKPVLTFGVAVFVLGSLLCGLAWSMPVLIAARAVQGIGAGAIQPIALTIVGDLYTIEERARVQGYMASVWGASSVLGPLVGGLFSDFLSWRWVFLINLPLGALALVALRRRFTETAPRRAHAIDYRGAALLTSGSALLVLGLLEGGHVWAWRSGTSAAVLGGALLLLAAFLVSQRHVAEPILPLWVLRHRVLVGGNLAALGVGALITGTASYVPTYVQEVLGTSAVTAGFAFGALTIGWPIAAALSGRVYLRLGFRDTALIGVSLAIAGSVTATRLGAEAPVWHVAGAMFVIGLGMGLSSSPLVVAVQSVVGREERGVVTGTNMFFRAMGSAVGVAVYGAIANATLPAGHGQTPARGDLYTATHHVFVAIAVTTVLIAVATAFVPRRTAGL